jgi:hypothetical protein
MKKAKIKNSCVVDPMDAEGLAGRMSSQKLSGVGVRVVPQVVVSSNKHIISTISNLKRLNCRVAIR